MSDEGLTRDALAPLAAEATGLAASPFQVPIILLHYLAAIVLAETIITFYPLPTGAQVGIGLHLGIIAALLLHGSMVQGINERLSRFLVAMVLVPLVRIFSLSLPLTGLPILGILLVVSIPLLAAPLSVMHVLGLKRQDVGWVLGGHRAMLGQLALALTGLPLGTVEFFILRPQRSWVPSLTLPWLAAGTAVVILASGVTEELIFRGVLLREGEQIMRVTPALIFVTVLFMAMHIGFASPVDLVFVFLVGLYFGGLVQRTGSLVGVTLAHGFANVILYLIMPFYF